MPSNNFNRLYVFFCFDSNYYIEDNLARGELTQNQIDWFVKENENQSKYIYFNDKKYIYSEGEIIKPVPPDIS